LLAQVKPVKIRFSEENFAFLEQLDGDLGTHVNMAVEMYIRRLREQDSAYPPECEQEVCQDAEQEGP
jgi:hypothetical protein